MCVFFFSGCKVTEKGAKSQIYFAFRAFFRNFARAKHHNKDNRAPIRAAKYIFRIIVGLLCTVYLTLLLLTSLPAFQSWGAEKASQLLAEKTGSRVSIGNLRLSMLGRVILDNVRLYDRSDTLMLQASRIAAKVDLLPLVEKKIRVDNAQLIGMHATLYKDGESSSSMPSPRRTLPLPHSTSASAHWYCAELRCASTAWISQLRQAD